MSFPTCYGVSCIFAHLYMYIYVAFGAYVIQLVYS
jgi:hypothetical protein